jgi:hypothetical protein
MQYEQHPLSALFPAMSDDDLAALTQDIKKNGQKEAVIVFEGKILDGWHRYLGCKKAGVKCATIKHDGKNPVAFVLSRNLHRRHLTGSQRAAVIVAATDWNQIGANRRGGSEPGSDPKSEAEMAAAAEVSDRTIRHAKAAHEAGLGDAVKEGKVSAKAAAEVAKLPKKEREKAVEAIERGDPIDLPKKPSAPGQSSKTKSTDYESLYKATLADLEAAREKIDEGGDVMRELNDRLEALETKDPDEQQKEIIRLRKQVAKLEAEIQRLTRSRNDFQAKCNELIRQVKLLQRKGGK